MKLLHAKKKAKAPGIEEQLRALPHDPKGKLLIDYRNPGHVLLISDDRIQLTVTDDSIQLDLDERLDTLTVTFDGGQARVLFSSKGGIRVVVDGQPLVPAEEGYSGRIKLTVGATGYLKRINLALADELLHLDTKALGKITYREADVVHFQAGLIGFPELKRFLFLADKETFQMLQSIDDPDIRFILVDPLLINPNYEVEVTPEQAATIGLTSEEDARISVIVTLKKKRSKSAVNFAAPLVFNPQVRQGMQVVLPGQETRRPLILNRAGKVASSRHVDL